MTRPSAFSRFLLHAAVAVGAAGGLALTARSQTPPAAAPPATATPSGPDEVTLVLRPGDRPLLRLAVPPFTRPADLPAEAGAAADELEATLRDDLVASRIFEIQGPSELAVLTLSGEAAKDHEQYRSLGNEILLAAELKLESERLVLEGRLIDLPSGQAILGKRYRGSYDLARRVAHTFADDVVLHFTGRKGIALTAIAFYSDREGDKEIYLMDYDGRNQRRITAHKSISMSPSWSAHGDSIAYVSFFGGSGPAIYLADVASGRKSPVVTSGSLNASPSFSPDGQSIAFARSQGNNIEVFVARRDGGAMKQLTYSSGIDTNPAWSPSGKEIAFTSSRGTGRPQIYVMDAEGANVRRITFTGDYNDGAAWSPDGTRIAYASRRGETNQFNVLVTDVVSLATTALVSRPGSHEHPSFSPDGRFVAFASTRGGKTQVFTLTADGQNERQLTSEGNSLAPDWSGYLD